MSVLLLDPAPGPYRALGQAPPIPGCMLVAALAGHAIDAFSEALEVAAQYPWCPLVIASTHPPSEATLDVLRLRASRPCAVRLNPSEPVAEPTSVRSAVARRPVVTDAEVLAFLGARCNEAVRTAVTEILRGSKPSPRLRRAAREVSALNRGDWVQLLALLRALSTALHFGLTQEQTAFRLGLATRTLWSWSQALMEMGWRDAVTLGSWEAVCEVVLRRHGLVRPPSATRQRLSGDFIAVHMRA